MSRFISFFVSGIPVPKGSAKAFVNKKTGRAIVTQDNRAKQIPWASTIAYHAQVEMEGPLLTGPVEISLEFYMPRLKAHFGTGKNAGVVKADAPVWHTSKSDLDKLVRCALDALTGIVWKDDSQVCEMGPVRKMYGDIPGVHITVTELG